MAQLFYTKTLAIAKQILSQNVVIPLNQVEFGTDPNFKFEAVGNSLTILLKNTDTDKFHALTASGTPTAATINLSDEIA